MYLASWAYNLKNFLSFEIKRRKLKGFLNPVFTSKINTTKNMNNNQSKGDVISEVSYTNNNNSNSIIMILQVRRWNVIFKE